MEGVIGKMKIPKKVLINSVPFKVMITNSLSLGMEYGGEISYGTQEINIRPLALECQEIIFLHECVHGMLDSLGYKVHDEKLVDGLAHQMYMLIKDNPEMFRKG